MALEQLIDDFHDDLLLANILDPPGIHHEFNGGDHGQKLDFDSIPTYANVRQTRFSTLYGDWLGVTARFIQERCPGTPDMILGTADGTNRVAEDLAVVVSELTDRPIEGYATEKAKRDHRALWLPRSVEKRIMKTAPELVIVSEDAATTGSQSVQIAEQALGAGAGRIVIIPTWQRQERLVRINAAIQAGSPIECLPIITRELPTYSPEDCAKTGFCAQGWKLIKRKKK